MRRLFHLAPKDRLQVAASGESLRFSGLNSSYQPNPGSHTPSHFQNVTGSGLPTGATTASGSRRITSSNLSAAPDGVIRPDSQFRKVAGLTPMLCAICRCVSPSTFRTLAAFVLESGNRCLLIFPRIKESSGTVKRLNRLNSGGDSSPKDGSSLENQGSFTRRRPEPAHDGPATPALRASHKA